MWIKRTLKVIIFCILLIGILNCVYRIFSWKDTDGAYFSSMDSLYNLKDDLTDVLFLGSSRCYCSINNSVLWEEYGISSFSLAISGQDLASSYYCLVEAVKHQSPEVVCLEMYGCNFSGYVVESNMYRNTLPFRMSINGIRAIMDIAGDQGKKVLFKWPIIHTRYSELRKEDFIKDRDVYLGYHAEFHTESVETLCSYYGSEQQYIGEEQEQWINKIINFCDEKSIKLVFFVAPYTSPDIDQKRYNYIEELAVQHDVPFINMSRMEEKLQLDLETDFIDWAHTNYYGAEKVSNYMGRKLKETFHLEDHRGDVRYDIWEEDLKIRNHEYKNYTLKQLTDIEEYFVLLDNLDDYIIIIDNTYSENLDKNVASDYLNNFIGEDIKGKKGIYILKNFEIVSRYRVVDFFEHIELEGNNIVISNEKGKRDIMLDNNSCIKVEEGINILIIDNLLGTVVDSIGIEYDSDVENGYKIVR